jgi:hypothetical protein
MAGREGSFFQAILAVEELSAVDPSAGVIVDVQNTICNNALLRWGDAAQKKCYLPRLAENTVASYALSEAGSGSDAFALATRAEDAAAISCSTAASCGSPTPPKPACLCCSPTPIRSRLQRHHGVPGGARFPGFQVGKKEDKLGTARVLHLRADPR